MTSFLFSSNDLPETLLEFVQLAKPSSYTDVAALGLIALGSAGYLLRGVAWDKPDPYHHLWYERPQEKDIIARNAKKETRNIAQKLEESDKHLVIFWGSQSGTAEGFANRLARECHLRFGLEVMAADLSDYDPETIALIPPTKFAIFIMSTFGEGDPSDNSGAFWEWLLKSPNTTVASLRYMAFGLGNSNYKYYNRVIDVVVEALDKFGARRLMAVGRADDAEGATEEDFMAWKNDLFSVFRKDLQLEEREVAHEPIIAVVEDDSLQPIDLHHGEPAHQRDNVKSAAASSPIKSLSVQNSRELFSSSLRRCIHMELDLNDRPELHYKTGDHLAVWPTNPDVEVERLLRALGLSERRDIPISIKSLDPTVKVQVPTPTTTSVLFRYYLEICCPVSRDTILSLAKFAPTAAAKSYLTTLGQDKTAYAAFLTHTHLNIGRLLELSTSGDPNMIWSNLPLSYLIETLPRTQPRYYSISSSSVISPRAPSITALVSTSSLPNAPTSLVHGLATNYLLALSQSLTKAGSQPHPHGLTYNLTGPSNALEGGKIFAHIRKSKFKLPVLASCPLIMAAAGTGLAPFRAFITERVRLKSMGKPVGKMILFFGCRHPDEDFIYKAELEEMEKVLEGKLRIVTAFSRVQGEKRVYVQDRMQEMSTDVLRLMSEGANFYICGRASMAREVGKRVGEAMGKTNGWTEQEVKEWSEGVKRRAKWQEDVWG
ncbi:riboflavin synthase domain-like protein [Lepidopterella palustris CBS 459.81]|uniref:NADPH--cytochrome P450 reductase n=1 Tax=Lepidopterella palustris CBS 459.81 TaxID=1314670 RepID=A0A8E2E0Y6_9PEZI|nr:riboflavin synthase domain-like protein [Lepidopterella palustris CBS 459.81]